MDMHLALVIGRAPAKQVSVAHRGLEGWGSPQIQGLGRLHIVRDSSFVKGNPAVLLSATTGDFDATGTVLFETYNARVVTVDYAFDNSTTLAKRDVCTVYGSAIAS